MRKIERVPLLASSLKSLRDRTQKILEQPSPEQKIEKAEKLWRSKLVCFKKDIEPKLLQMAANGGLCMYCEGSEANAIDHFWPKSLYPEHAFVWENYLWACAICNSNLKRAEFPLEPNTKKPMLIDPTSEDPAQSMRLSPRSGEFSALNERAKVTIKLFDLNHDEKRRPRDLAAARKNTWIKLTQLIVSYAIYREAGRLEDAQDVRAVIRDEPFPAVLSWMLYQSKLGRADILFVPGRSKECLRILRDPNFKEIHSWL